MDFKSYYRTVGLDDYKEIIMSSRIIIPKQNNRSSENGDSRIKKLKHKMYARLLLFY